jgi:hypothetical protein
MTLVLRDGFSLYVATAEPDNREVPCGLVLGCHRRRPQPALPTFLVNGRVLLEAGAVRPRSRSTGSGTERLISHAHLDHMVGLAFLADNVRSAVPARCR